MFKKKDSKFLSKKVDKITSLFTKTIEKLQEKALEADELRTKTIEKIEIMEKSPIVILSWQNMITERQSYVYDLKNNLRLRKKVKLVLTVTLQNMFSLE